MENKVIISKRLTNKQLSEVSLMKSIRWIKYSATEHRLWLMEKSNLMDDHLLIYEEDILVAYAQFKTNITIQNIKMHKPFVGVGNVCSIRSGKGYGRLLLKEIKNFIMVNDVNGILFTTFDKTEYYIKGGWQIIDLNILQGTNETIAMIFSKERINLTNDISYMDELF